MKRFNQYAAFSFVLALALLASGCGKSQRLTGVAPQPDDATPQVGTTSSVLLPEAIPTGLPLQTATLLAGRTMPVGEVTLWIEGNSLGVRYRVNTPWNMRVTHLAVAASAEGLPVNPAGNPQVGQFPWSKTHPEGVTEHIEMIDLAALGLASASTVEVAAQADLAQWSGAGDLLASAGAWAEGTEFEYLIQAGRGKDKGQGSWAMHFTADLAKLRGLLLWNKLGSRWEIEHSVCGPNGLIDGNLSYPAGKYGNGFKPMARTGDHNVPANFVDFPGLKLPSKGCIEFWYWPDWNDWRVGHVNEILYYGQAGVAYSIGMQYNDWQDYQGSGVGDAPASSAGAGQDLRPSTTPGWTTAQPFHIALTWDGSAPAVLGSKVRIYYNGVQVGDRFYLYGNPTFATWEPAAILRLASRINGGDWNRHNWEGDHAVIDNLKVWGFAKSDFSDRFVE